MSYEVIKGNTQAVATELERTNEPLTQLQSIINNTHRIFTSAVAGAFGEKQKEIDEISQSWIAITSLWSQLDVSIKQLTKQVEDFKP